MTISIVIPDLVAQQMALAAGMPADGVAKDFIVENLRTKITNQIHVNLRRVINDDVTAQTTTIMDQVVIS